MCRFCSRFVPIAFLCLILSICAPGQSSGLGRRIYEENAKSVLVLYAMSPTGELVAQGSGFWVVGQKIITNAHVANAGKIVVELGPARVPTKLEKIDDFNDLAVLTVNVELVAKPLQLAEHPPSVGDTVYAIGNPEGLEETISEGLISGLRQIDGRRLLQITAPISHGSSGGPILNSNGEVVGVAVAGMREGQNLNFAVPASFVINLLTKAENSSAGNALTTLEEIQRLSERQETEKYSDDKNSAWQTDRAEIDRLLHKAFSESGTNPEILVRVSNAALSQDTDLAIEVAQRAVDLKHSSDAEFALAASLDQKAEWTFKDDNEKQSLLTRAEKAARSGMEQTKKPSVKDFFLLANILEDEHSNSEALRDFQLAWTASRSETDGDLRPNILRGLSRCSFALDEYADSQRWFEQLVATGNVNAYDWWVQALRLGQEMKFKESGAAYQAAAELNGSWSNWCDAATEYNASNDDDNTIFAARKCIELGTGETDSENALAMAHRQIAEILNKRGVYSEGLNHAKESVTLNPNEAFAYDDLGDALKGLHRYQEALNAFQQALRLSDGKYAWMHFKLGSVYSEMENWDFAQQSFEKSAELDPKDPASAYNVAVCNAKRHYYGDAANWYEEYLRRKPNASDREDILNRIRILRSPD